MNNDELREKTGNFKSTDKLTNFLYLLMRDELTCGFVEKLIRESEKKKEILFTNGYLAAYAELLSERLKND